MRQLPLRVVCNPVGLAGRAAAGTLLAAVEDAGGDDDDGGEGGAQQQARRIESVDAQLVPEAEGLGVAGDGVAAAARKEGGVGTRREAR